MTPLLTRDYPHGILTRGELLESCSVWITETEAVAFAESEDGDITAAGHVDPKILRRQVERYWEITGGDLPFGDERLSLEAIAHRWAIVHWTAEYKDEWRADLVPEGTPGALPITTIWGWY